MLRASIVVLVLLASGAATGGDVWAEFKPKLQKAAEAYVKAYAKPAEKDVWDRKLDERIRETGRSLQDIALDWFFDHESELSNKEGQQIKEACFFFLAFVRHDAPPPLQMRSRMTPENFQDIIGYLEMKVEETR